MSVAREAILPAPAVTVSYTASLIGTIGSHLAGLQGYDVMALELIQNADDAGSDGKGSSATRIVFDVTDEALVVRNDGEFTYCGNLGVNPCPRKGQDGQACDYHRITEVASGGKLSSSDNTGRFGIGFVSTYQIADHPQIHSAGIRLTLMPELGNGQISETKESSGTTFVLPWASDPNSETRRQLSASALTRENIEQLVADFEGVLRKALLFLRRLRRAELRRNGKPILTCDLERNTDDDAELLVTFNDEEVERWIILRADASEGAAALVERFPQLGDLKRKTSVSIGIRVDPGPIPAGGGLLYAYLPTEQPTGLPVHINADFFPESDRKAVIFAGNQHQQAWNQLLIDTAAAKLADSLEILRDKLGSVPLWAMLECAYKITVGPPSKTSEVFGRFWAEFKGAVARGARVAETAAGTFELPGNILLPKQPPENDQLAVLHALGGKVVSEALRSYWIALVQLGAKELTFSQLVALMEPYFDKLPEAVDPEPEERLDTWYLPLWELADALLPKNPTGKAKESVEKVKDIPFIVDPDRYPRSINDCYRAVAPTTAARLTEVPPYLPFASDLLANFSNLNGLIDAFDLESATAQLRFHLIHQEKSPEDVLGSDEQALREFYKILAVLSEPHVDRATYDSLRELPIWATAKGFVSAKEALLPGDFQDPIGETTLIKQSLVDTRVRQFVSEKLGVRRQTIEEYVRVVVPRFIGEAGPENLSAFRLLLETLANHLGLLNNDELREILAGLPMIPTEDGGWATPDQTYFRTEDLAALLGEAEHRWVCVSQAGGSRAVRAFLHAIGVRRSASVAHLAERMVEIAEAEPPTEEAKKASEKAFYEICDLYTALPNSLGVQDAIMTLAANSCLPAYDDDERWFSPRDLHAPYRYQAFESQANVLDFRNTQRLSTALLEELGIETEPATALVVRHLLHCVSTSEPAHALVYQILNERARNEDPALARLRGEPCIYLESQQAYIRPNQLYWTPQQLGKYTYTVPPGLESHKALFKSLGVKDSPEASDYVDIVLDIVEGNFAPQTPLDPADLRIYETCISGIASAWIEGVLTDADLERLRDAPSVPNILGHLRHPDELLLRDSEYHRGFFGKELDDTLCRSVDPELMSFFEALGARRLSDVVSVALDFVEGLEHAEEDLCEALLERSEILARMLHDHPRAVRDALHGAIRGLSARSYDRVRIKATLDMDGEEVSAEPIETKAFYDLPANALVLARPVSERSWLPVFNALLHQLMPEESPASISRMALALKPLMAMSVADAEESLSEAHVPYLEVDAETDIDVTSGELDGVGTEPGDDGEQEAEQREAGDSQEKPSAEAEGAMALRDPTADANAQDDAADGAGTVDGAQGAASAQSNDAEHGGDREEIAASPASGAESRGDPDSGAAGTGVPGSGGSGTDHRGTSSDASRRTSSKRKRHGRSQSKSLWDRALITYVREKRAASNEDADEGGSEDAQYKLAIEAAARAAVCEYERAHGREPEERSQTHPGYDIVSRNPGAEDILRYIEVKGTSGEWDKRGVGLSRLQFTNAQELGDRFWLYVVEFALEDNGSRVHAIRNPALRVDHFMFDGGWRDVAVDEAADPAVAFVSGARIDCGLLGEGVIQAVEQRGQSRLLTVAFDDGRKTPLPLNLKTMRVIEASDGDDDS